MQTPPPSYWIAVALSVPISAVVWALAVSGAISIAEDRKFLPLFIFSALPFGIVLGFLNGLVLAVLCWVNTQRVCFQDRENFLAKLHQAARKLHYKPYLQEATLVVFRPTRAFNWPHNRFAVQIGEGYANISGPWLTVRKLRRRSPAVNLSAA